MDPRAYLEIVTPLLIENRTNLKFDYSSVTPKSLIEIIRKMPKNMRVAKTIDEFLEILGLHDKKTFFILSTGLRKTKEWILRRIISSKWASKSNPRMVEESKEALKMMYEPFPEDNEDEDKEKKSPKSASAKYFSTKKKSKKDEKEKEKENRRLWDIHKYIDESSPWTEKKSKYKPSNW